MWGHVGSGASNEYAQLAAHQLRVAQERVTEAQAAIEEAKESLQSLARAVLGAGG